MDQDLDTFGVGIGGFAIYCSDAGENMRYAVDVTEDGMLHKHYS